VDTRHLAFKGLASEATFIWWELEFNSLKR